MRKGTQLKNFSKKLIVFGLILFGLSFPLQKTLALPIFIPILLTLGGVALGLGVLSGQSFLVTSVGNILAGLIAIFLQIWVGLAFVFLAIAIFVFQVATHPNFINKPFTKVTPDNPIVYVGWNFIRNIANMGIVLGFVIIGIGTALGIAGYRWQETLPKLILVALLVNFTPVLCGLLVDGTNIAMDFFLRSGFSFDFLGQLMLQYYSHAIGTLKGTPGTAFSTSFLGKTLVMIGFCVFGGLFLFLYAILFILRYIAIWVLVILSPLAALAYVFPLTRNFFNLWWKNFFSWCFVGVTAAFFLYLAGHVLLVASSGELVNVALQAKGEDRELAGLINDLLPFFVANSFVGIGFFTALSTSAMGADWVIKAFQTKGVATVAGAAAKAGKWAGTKTLGALRGMPWFAKGEKLARQRIIEGRLLPRGDYERRLKERYERARKGVEKLVENVGIDRAREILLREPKVWTEEAAFQRRALYEILAERGKLTDNDKELLQRARDRLQFVGLKEGLILSARPDWADVFGKNVDEVMREFGAQERARIQTEAFKNIDVLRNLLDHPAAMNEIAQSSPARMKAFLNGLTQYIPTKIAKGTPEEVQKWIARIDGLSRDPLWAIPQVREIRGKLKEAQEEEEGKKWEQLPGLMSG